MKTTARIPGSTIGELLGAALRREREHRRRPAVPPAQEANCRHVFRCVCCERPRADKHRREPDSEVCVFCVTAAGLDF